MKNQNKIKGFTLIELIVVLVILAILIALLVPALTGYIKKANEKKALAECRMAVEATQTILSEKYGDGSLPEVVLNPSLIYTDVLKLGEVTGEILGDIQFDSNAKLTYLEYVYQKRVIAIYDISHDPNYYISETSSKLYAYVNDAASLSEKLFDKTLDRKSLIAEMAKKYGALQVDSYFTDKTSNYKGKTLYWRPYYFRDPDGNFSIFLYANSDANVSSHSQWSANLIYANGHLYEAKDGVHNIANYYQTCSNLTDFQAQLKTNENIMECK